MIRGVDAVLDTDWAAHWRMLVDRREVQTGPRQDDFWNRRAHRFALSMRGQADPFLDFLEPWLSPSRTLIDVGAGTGRHVHPLARRLDWVTAVEPSQAMRDLIPPADNVTVIASGWLDADPAPADLVTCVNVLYPIADAVPFLRKLEQSARERVFVVLRDSPSHHPAEQLAGPGRMREPRLRDAFLLLRQLDVAPDVHLYRVPAFFRFESLEAAVEDCRLRLGPLWEETAGRAFLDGRLRPADDGTVVFDAGELTSGVLHWTPRS